MSNIDVRRFVDINISHHKSSAASGTRKTAVLFVSDSSINTYISDASYLDNLSDTTGKTIGKWFFANGGKELHVLSIGTTSAFAQLVYDLPNEEIVLLNVFPHSNFDVVAKTIMENTVSGLDFKGIKRKLFVEFDNEIEDWTNDSLIKWTCQVSGDCGVVAAYLTKLDVYKTNSVNDFDFTPVTLLAGTSNVNTSDEQLSLAINSNSNILAYLANDNRVIGGNTSTGNDLVNEFVLIVLQQTVTNVVLNVLMSKLKGEQGIMTINTAIAQELNKYVAAGYLVTDRVWTDENLVKTYNEMDFTIIEKDTPVVLGYVIKSLPLSVLSNEDKAAHKAPPIYLVLATSYGIRVVTGLGEVF